MNPPPTLAPWPVIGHETAVSLLAHAVASGQVAHAYLFSGPDQVGKQTLARLVAQALLCTAEGGQQPCGACRACRLVAASRHSDFLTLDLAWQATALPDRANAQSLTVEAVRLMTSELSRRPHEGAWKVLLIPDADALTVAAANAFLKTLEEPPPSVVLLLTTRDAELLLPTIRSRCQPVPLRPLPIGEVEAALRARGCEEAPLLARLSGGRIGWALEAHASGRALRERARALDALAAALPANRAERLLQGAALAKEEPAMLFHHWASWWRDLLLVQAGVEESVANVDRLPELRAAAERYDGEQARAFLGELQRLRRLAETTNASRQLIWESLLLKLPRAGEG